MALLTCLTGTMIKGCAQITCIVLTSLALPAAAMDFSAQGNDSKTLTAVSATGNVVWDDAERLDRYLSRVGRRRNTAVYFDSPGGSLGGGIRLGEYLRRNRIKAVVEGGGMCASACALAFLGGTDRTGARWMSSTTTSRLGFHAFRNGDGSRLDDTDRTQQIVGEMLEYGHTVNAPMEIFVRTFQTASDDMYWFSTAECLSLGIKVWDMERGCFVGSAKCAGASPASGPGRPEPRSAARFVERYYSLLKHVPYAQTWAMLSPEMRRRVGFDSYVGWWDGKVDRVTASEIRALSDERVQARLSYRMKSGKHACSVDTFELGRAGRSWQFLSQSSRGCP
ncbi:MAG: hypothetical protein LJE69_11035 [Thiohalocapsa sp.]|nr:hypothetical protein [Thiohalocapsa sp.]